MAQQKNQHYVPQFYLKNFSTDKKTIGSYVLSTGKIVQAAAIKNICSENNFYGSIDAEKELSEIESKAADIISRIINDSGRTLSRDDIDYLKLFVILQQNRTLHSSTQIQDGISQLIDHIVSIESDVEVKNNMDKMRLSKKDSVGLSMDVLAHAYEYTQDLSLKIIENNTKVPFITSDDPVVLYDQFLESICREKYGLAMKGIQVILPVSPSSALFIYDSRTYKVGTRKGQIISTITDNDVAAINKLIVIYSNEVIYYKNGTISDCELKRIAQQGLIYKRTVSNGVEILKNVESQDELIHIKGEGVYIGAKFSFVKLLDVAKAFIYTQSQSTTISIRDITRDWPNQIEDERIRINPQLPYIKFR